MQRPLLELVLEGKPGQNSLHVAHGGVAQTEHLVALRAGNVRGQGQVR